MAKCETIRQFMIDYADGRLSAALSRDVVEHLEGCAPCQTEARSLAVTWKLLEHYPAAEPGADFMDGVRRKIHPRGSGFLKILAPLVAAAAILLIVLAVSTGGGAPQIDAAEVEFKTLPAGDQELLSKLLQDGNWELIDNSELIKAYEVVDREGGHDE